ncbi:MAG: dipeptidase [Chloroflexota bacterium]
MKYPIFDGHNDTILDIYLNAKGHNRSFFERSEHGHIDLPRAREAGLAAGFFAHFVPNPPKEQTMSSDNFPGSESKKDGSYELNKPIGLDFDYATKFAMGMANLMLDIERNSEGGVKIAKTVSDIKHCMENDVLAMIYHFEGAEMIDENLNALSVYYAAGLRSLGPVWSRDNIFAHGVPFKFPSLPDVGPGLTDVGKKLLKRCNQLGILFDLSHLNEKGFWDVEHLSDAPMVATHSNAHSLCASARNLSDKQLDAIAASDGVVGLNYHTGFLRSDGKMAPDTSLKEIVRHALYMADRIGTEHIVLGSDFDGAQMPSDLKDVTGMPKLIDALSEAGFSHDDLMKITHQNWLRVLKHTWK